jgi:membrane-bound lytic murein transglycosylase A
MMMNHLPRSVSTPAYLPLVALLSALLVACGSSPQKAIEIPGEVQSSRPASSAPISNAPASVATSASSAGGSTVGEASTFSTQLANYTASGFESVPGWSNDNFVVGAHF